MTKPKLIQGNFFNDERGILSFVNEFNFLEKKIQRFYIVKNYQNNFIRAWHGHEEESKFVYCLNGSAKVCCVKIDNFNKPNKNEKIYSFNLNENKPSIVFVPKGYANGFMNTEPNTKLMFLSDKSLEQSKKDDFRYEYNFWNPWKINFY